MESDEERLERERRVQVELLEGAPGLPHDFGGLQRPVSEVTRHVLAQVVESIRVDSGRLGSRRDDDEIAIPGLESFEPCQKLLALRSALSAPHTLIGLPCGKVDTVERRLFSLLRLVPVLVGDREERRGGISRLEAGVEIRGARRGDQRLAPVGRGRVEQPARAVETPRRGA